MFVRGIARAAVLLAVPMTFSMLAPSAAHAATPKIKVSDPGGIIQVYDTPGNNANILLNGTDLSSTSQLVLNGVPICSTPAVQSDGRWHTTCTPGTNFPIAGWDIQTFDGADVVFVLNAIKNVSVNTGSGNDAALVANTTVSLSGGDGDDLLALGASQGPSEVRGGAGNDTIWGHAGFAPQNYADHLYGGGGADTFNAKGEGFDFIDCGQGDGARDTVNMDFSPFVDSTTNCGKDTKQ